MFSSNTSAVSGDANYIEDVFSTYLYTGNGSTQTITNGIDLSGKGGLVWLKGRNTAGTEHELTDTARGTNSNGRALNSNDAQANQLGDLTSFTSSGFGLSYNTANGNLSGESVVSWTFRKQAKFFDVVTYTGTGSATTIAHNLGSVPGCIIVKRTDAARDWAVYHRSLGATQGIYLNSTAAAFTALTALWNGTTPTSTVFSVGGNADVNASGGTYVAYLFAHDAGGFGLTGTDNVISCGSFTTDGSGNATVNLGYEPQWVMVKTSSEAGNWDIIDNMRGFPVTGNDRTLRANLSNAEADLLGYLSPTATGFSIVGSATATYVYIAIRRGPMKTPTSGTSVYETLLDTAGTKTLQTSTASFPLDMQFNTLYSQSNATYNNQINDRLRGIGFEPSFSSTPKLTTASTAAEDTSVAYLSFKGNGRDVTKGSGWGSTVKALFYNFRRAPGFFDVVCYTGTGTSRTVSHNLGVAPELMIVKNRNFSAVWMVYSAALGNTGTIYLNDSDIAYYSATYWNSTTPTSSVFSLGTSGNTNGGAGQTYVAYLFASCPGVSKVGSYTGSGTTKQIDCGFTGGARFVLIKRTDSTGDWYVWDSARGIVAGNDPYLLLNSTAAEVTNTDYVDTYSAGFEISSTAPAAINANGGTFIFLAIS